MNTVRKLFRKRFRKLRLKTIKVNSVNNDNGFKHGHDMDMKSQWTF